MVETRQQFGRRVTNLNKKNAQFARGYYTTLRNDGLVIARPARLSFTIQLKTLAALVVIFFLFKAFVLSAVGPGAYQIRLNELNNGTLLEQAGAWALGMDHVTLAISSKIGPVFRG